MHRLGIVKLSLLSFIVIASAPAEKEINLKPLTVTWEENAQPLAVSLRGEVVKITNQQKLKLPRIKFPQETLKLLVIPANEKFAPFWLPTKDSSNTLVIKYDQFKTIKESSIWLWGQTPKSHCRGNTSIAFRFLNKKSVYKSVSGLFAWEVNKADLPDKPVLYAVAHLTLDEPKRLSSAVFEKASPEQYFKCKVYHGGDCSHVFEFNKEIDGYRFEVTIEPSRTPKFKNCPI